jgi:predicted nucleic acid-binding protein
VTRVFVDTWAWYALTDSVDAGHGLAQLANDELLDSDCAFVTANFMLAETITLLRYPPTDVPPFASGRRCSIRSPLVQLVCASQAH